MLCCDQLLHTHLDVPSSPSNVFWCNKKKNKNNNKTHARYTYASVQRSEMTASKKYLHCLSQLVVMIELPQSTSLYEVTNMVKQSNNDSVSDVGVAVSLQWHASSVLICLLHYMTDLKIVSKVLIIPVVIM